MTMLKIVALISGGGSNLQAIIDACENGQIPGEVVCVGSDVPDIYGLERAEKHKIPWFVTDYSRLFGLCKRKFAFEQRCQDPAKVLGESELDMVREPSDFGSLITEAVAKQTLFAKERSDLREMIGKRIIAEARLLEELEQYEFDLLVLAGFMRNFTPYFIDRINTDPGNPRIMNIHPALLPSFPGVDGYGDTYRNGCKVGGCTVHFIDYGEDSGPIIGQKAFSIIDGMTLDDVKREGLSLEWELYPWCINKFAFGELRIVEKEFLLDNGQLVKKRIVEVH